MKNQLDQRKKVTKVVADTGDVKAMRVFTPQDATTNPSLVLKVCEMPEYGALVKQAIEEGRSKGVMGVMDRISVLVGIEILNLVPGRVSTEVDARLSFDREGTVSKARTLIADYEREGFSRDRILIKIASTWEGIKAAESLEKEGIHCNLTLLFSFAQAVACAEAGVQLISPFVGRIYDWYRQRTGIEYAGANDPGVQSVTKIYNYYKKFDYKTEVMGASFRNVTQIQELAGCDLLTISPDLLAALARSPEDIITKLTHENAKQSVQDRLSLNEQSFRFLHNNDAMAVEKTAEGIRNFVKDTITLEEQIMRQL